MPIFDLSMEIDGHTPVFPGDSKPEITASSEQGIAHMQIRIGNHVATHIDAPLHMVADGKTLDEFPMETLVGQAVVLDMRDPDLRQIETDDRVFLYTGHTDRRHSDAFFLNNPQISMELAQKLIAKGIKVIGIDSYTVDNEPFDVHKAFLSKDILIIENLVNLKPLLGKRFQCCILPLKLKNADGAPCRVIGIL